MEDPGWLEAEENFKNWIEKRSVWCRARQYTESEHNAEAQRINELRTL